MQLPLITQERIPMIFNSFKVRSVIFGAIFAMVASYTQAATTAPAVFTPTVRQASVSAEPIWPFPPAANVASAEPIWPFPPAANVASAEPIWPFPPAAS
jgi:hypothetical protein